MPNYVYNVLSVYAKDGSTQEDVVNFLKQHINEDNFFDFNTIIPEPESPSEVEDEFNYLYTKTEEKEWNDSIGKSWFNWYDWRYKYWGVKWNSGGKQFFDYDKILNDEDGGILAMIKIVFETAWYPPLPVIKKLILMHPELNISCEYYSCESMIYGYIGKSYFQENEVVHEGYKINTECNHEEVR